MSPIGAIGEVGAIGDIGGTAARPERKAVLVTRRTRLQDLLLRHHTLAQARFYIEHLGADFGDYQREQAAYAQALEVSVQALRAWGRHQVIDRAYLPNVVFAADDIVIALGPDGLVANVMKYLDGQPLLGLNPEPGRWDGLLLPFAPRDLPALLADVAAQRRPVKPVTMAEAVLSDGQVLRGVNDIFIGPRSHTSAWYDITLGERRETQSSSGVIVATGLGSTGWLRSVITGSTGISAALQPGRMPVCSGQPWDGPQLTFVVREPFPSRSSQAGLVHGTVTAQQPLTLCSRMPEHGVIFSDGMESDFLRFTAGMIATIRVADRRGCLVV